MVAKPRAVFDRDREWQTLSRFVEDDRVGATLGIVYGRRRQGKTFLLANLTKQVGGFMYGANQEGGPQSLRSFSEAYSRYTGRPVTYFDSWRAAIDGLFRIGDQPTLVVIDEFSYLTGSVPGLASMVQLAMDPGGWAHGQSRVRLILCGSAMSTMQNLLAGSAPLRGRAMVNLVVQPFGFRDSAAYWGLNDQPELAFRVHALLGGTPAYRQMVGEVPDDLSGFDQWVGRRLLEPNEAIYGEGNILLQQQPELVDVSLYFGVLAAISGGAHRRSDIANAIGRPATALAHSLSALESVRFIARTDDAFRSHRPIYHIAEPVIRFHQLVIAHNEPVLALGDGRRVWSAVADTVAAKIYGPHLEDLARQWCLAHASVDTLGGLPTTAAPTVLSCGEHKAGHELDVVVRQSVPNGTDRILAIGEAKATNRMVGDGELTRLDHLRDLIPERLRSDHTKLLLFSRAGFTAELRRSAEARPDVELVDLHRLYQGD